MKVYSTINAARRAARTLANKDGGRVAIFRGFRCWAISLDLLNKPAQFGDRANWSYEETIVPDHFRR